MLLLAWSRFLDTLSPLGDGCSLVVLAVLGVVSHLGSLRGGKSLFVAQLKLHPLWVIVGGILSMPRMNRLRW